jgi:hypothetical protein
VVIYIVQQDSLKPLAAAGCQTLQGTRHTLGRFGSSSSYLGRLSRAHRPRHIQSFSCFPCARKTTLLLMH